MNKILLTILWLTSIAIAVYAGKQLNTQSANPIELSHSTSSVASCPSTVSKSVVKPERSASVGKLCLLEQQLAKASVSDVVNDFLDAQKSSGSIGLGMEAQMKFYVALSQMSEAELAHALDLANQHGSDMEKIQILSTILTEYAKISPQKALRFVDKEMHGNQYTYIASSVVVSAWAVQDPDAALAWFVEMSSAKQNKAEKFAQDIASVSIFSAMARKDMNYALSQIANVPQEENILASVAMGITQAVDEDTDLNHVLNELSAFNSPAMVNMAINHLVTRKPEEVAMWLDQQESSKAVDSNRLTVVNQWVTSEPDQAMAWFLADKEGKARESAINDVTRHWGARSPAQALAWLNKQENINTAQATENVINNAAYTNPSFTAENLHRITDEKSRKAISERLVGWFYKQDKEATLAFIESSPFRESLEQKLAEHKKEQGYN
ncbi:hypothetical protein [Thalassotalea fusca]